MALLCLPSVPSLVGPGRSRFVIAGALLLGLAGRVEGQPGGSPSLTEAEVVARALGRASLSDAIEGEVAIEEGRGTLARVYPNAEVSYAREQTFGTLGTAENYLSMAQTIDLANRRGLRGEAGAVRAQAARAEGEGLRASVAADARLRFYDVLYRQQRVNATVAWLAGIDAALEIVKRREGRGDAAIYDRRRLERERAVAAGRLEVEGAGLERAQARLGAIVGANVSLSPVTGTLLPATDPMALADLRASSSARPDMTALRLRIDAAALDGTAVARWWIPDLRVEGGWKGVDLARQGRTDGYLLGLSLSMPLWNQFSGAARIAAGEARAARGRRALLASELEGELAGARAEAVRLRRAAVEFRAQALAASAEVVRIASAGYSGGEVGLLELLDAHRGSAEDALTVLDLEQVARRARIELDRRTGAGLP